MKSNTLLLNAFGAVGSAPGANPAHTFAVCVPRADSTYMAQTTALGTVPLVPWPAAVAVSDTVVGATAFRRMPRGVLTPAQWTNASRPAQLAEIPGQLLFMVRAARPEVMVTDPLSFKMCTCIEVYHSPNWCCNIDRESSMRMRAA